MGHIGFLDPGPPPQRPVGVQIYTGRVFVRGHLEATVPWAEHTVSTFLPVRRGTNVQDVGDMTPNDARCMIMAAPIGFQTFEFDPGGGTPDIRLGGYRVCLQRQFQLEGDPNLLVLELFAQVQQARIFTISYQVTLRWSKVDVAAREIAVSGQRPNPETFGQGLICEIGF
jgi:hypothetical protein